MLVSGSVLQGRYRIERVLGQGGMGAVYLATEELLGGKRVAVKEMNVNIDDPTERLRAVEQFQKEARILATLDHPGLVDVTHYFEEAGKQYLVMAFIDGKTLETLLNEEPGFLPTLTVLDWIDQVCDVLEYLHGHEPSIIFRDMKPSNVMLDARHRIRLIDFGIARSFDSGKTATFIKGAGTAGFAPLEQYGKGGTTDPRTDIYAVGATLYCLLTRSLPPSSVDLVTKDEELIAPSQLNPSLGGPLEKVIVTMMGLRKEDRYQSMAAARQSLRMARPQSDSDTAQMFIKPRFCSNCGATAVAAQTACGRCGAPLEMIRTDTDTGRVVNVSEETARKESAPVYVPPAPVPVPNSLPEVQQTQPNVGSSSGMPAAVGAGQIDPLATQMPSRPWSSGSLSQEAPKPQPQPLPATAPTPAPKPVSPLPQTHAAPPPAKAGSKAMWAVPATVVAVALAVFAVKNGSHTDPTPIASGSPAAIVSATPAPTQVAVTAVSSSPTVGVTLTLAVAPAGARASLDEGPVSLVTSVTLTPGHHKLEFTQDGYHSVTVELDASTTRILRAVPLGGTQANLSASTLEVLLVPKDQGIALDPTPAEVQLAIDDVETRRPWVKGEKLYLSGKHMLTFTAKGYERMHREFSMDANVDPKLAIRLTMLDVPTLIETFPGGAHVKVDGHPYGGKHELAPGPHKLEVTHEGYFKKELTITVPVAQNKFEVHLERVPPPPVEHHFNPPPVEHHYNREPEHHRHPQPQQTEAPPIRG